MGQDNLEARIQTLTVWLYLMCHLQDKLALGEQVGWRAQL